MKFVALALALFLAVGSQAASLQADAPSQLDHFRAVADVYAEQVREGAKRALEKLEGTQYSELKPIISQRIDDFHSQLKAAQQSIAPMTDNFVKTIADATVDVRASVQAEFDTLKAEIEAKRDQLRPILEKHFDEYRVELEPILKEYVDKHNADIESHELRLQPVVESLRHQGGNQSGRDQNCNPAHRGVTSALGSLDRLEGLKAVVGPYVDEYKDQLAAAYSRAQSVDRAQLEQLREKIAPLAADIKVKVQAMFEAIVAASTRAKSPPTCSCN
ncbi:LOW QUALITY PROTEIN: apolipoprotein A-I-like [Salarias fasciatus]|uniref:LOW QUALITY PROTEIN: apolipoprotein A-I-like n=1 Tax=Salarias fasciatus TaxID=181472 RepID=UPI001176F6DB|nr:LOW QUALITY PROTEIN: apolipoprotein A-I-like [Salarias fasciatus]